MFRSVRGGFWAPVSGRHFSISLSAGRRPVRLQTETGSQGTLGESGGRRHEVHSFGRFFDRHTMRFLSGKAVFGWAFVSGDLGDLSGQWIDRVHARRPPRGV